MREGTRETTESALNLFRTHEAELRTFAGEVQVDQIGRDFILGNLNDFYQAIKPEYFFLPAVLKDKTALYSDPEKKVSSGEMFQVQLPGLAPLHDLNTPGNPEMG